MNERIGQQLGNYHLLRFIGQGGFADVYLGEHMYLSTQAAIKVLQTRLGSDDLQAFQIEARTIAHLRHPNIIRVLEFGEEQNIPYLIMDFAPNGTLRQRHPKGMRLSLNECISYIRPIASALQYAHNHKIVHRDIKPENMLVGQNGEILLSDFGIAIVSQSSRYHGKQEVGGTVAYMAPEQLNGKAVAASDQYALGIVLYEWLSGNIPFIGSFTEICSQHLFTPPPSLHEKAPYLPPACEEVVMRALSKRPEERFPTISAFVETLETAVQGLPVAFITNQNDQSTVIKDAVQQRSASDTATTAQAASETYLSTQVSPLVRRSTMLPLDHYPPQAQSPLNHPGSGLDDTHLAARNRNNNASLHLTPPLIKSKASKAPMYIIALLVCVIIIIGMGGLYLVNAQKSGNTGSNGNTTAQMQTTGTTKNSQQSVQPTNTPVPTPAGRTVSLNRVLSCINPPCKFKITLTKAVINDDTGQVVINFTLKSLTFSGSTGLFTFDLQDQSGQTYTPQGQVMDSYGGQFNIVAGQSLTLAATYSLVIKAGSIYTLKCSILNGGGWESDQNEQFTFQ